MRLLLIAAACWQPSPPRRPRHGRSRSPERSGTPARSGCLLQLPTAAMNIPYFLRRTRTTIRSGLPTASSIVFTSERDGSADLYRVKPDGSGLDRLTTDPAYDDQAAFSPDSKQLVFVSTRGSGRRSLWILDLSTRSAKALTSGPGRRFPAIVVSGRKVDRVLLRPRQPDALSPRTLGAPSDCGYLHHSPGRLRVEEDHGERKLLRQPEMDGRQPSPRGLLHDGGTDVGESHGESRSRK